MTSAAPFAAASLCVIGNLNRDLRVAPLPAGDYLFQDGETSAAFIAETPGGGGANTACAAAALGARVALLSRVGADAVGLRLEQVLRRQGVVPCLKRDSAVPTGTSINLAYTTGHRHFVSCLPNNETLAPADLDLSVLPQYEHLARTDVWFSEAMLFGGNEQLFRAARAAGMAVSIDLNWDPQWGVARESEVLRRKGAIREVLALVDLVHGNVRELCEFACCNDLDSTLRRIVEYGARAVVIHMGREGAGYFDGESLVVAPAIPPARQVNTTGTGDVLSVCMMLQHHQAMPVRDKLRLANTIVSEYIEATRTLLPVM